MFVQKSNIFFLVDIYVCSFREFSIAIMYVGIVDSVVFFTRSNVVYKSRAISYFIARGCHNFWGFSRRIKTEKQKRTQAMHTQRENGRM